MCKFCDNIHDVEKYEKIDPYCRIDCIVKHKDIYGYWHECEDWYYSGILFEINYCPKCGRKLN